MLDPNTDSWYYNTLTFAIRRGIDKIVCILSPSYGDMQLIWSQGNREILNLEISHIKTIKVVNEHNTEALHVEFKESIPLERLHIRMKPDIHVLWGTKLE